MGVIGCVGGLASPADTIFSCLVDCTSTLGLGRQVQKLFRGQASQECENQSFSLGLAVRIASVSAVRSSG
jgi:hypothetical protein